MAYSAAVTVDSVLSVFVERLDVLLYEDDLKVFEVAATEVKSFMTFVEGLDSRSREMMKLSLQRTANTILYLKDQLFSEEETPDEGEEEIKMFRILRSLIETVKKMREEYYSTAAAASSSTSTVVSKSNMVGLRNYLRSLKHALLDLRIKNPVFVIAGTAGIGKTTLAREMFQDLDVLDSFDCCVWVNVGYDREWKSEEITRAILAQVDPDAHQMLVKSEYEEEVGRLRLKQSMESKKYLVVLDDVSYDDVLDYMRSSFPDNINGSRVVLTTRKKMMNDQYDILNNHILEMRLMNEEESWDLLCDRVFGGKRFPPELEKPGKMIAKRCDGLPLTIVTVADLLSKADDNRESFWADVATQRKHQVFVEAYDLISEVLLPQYNQLGDKFKLCFLYMGVFPANYEIYWSKLINLWTAEKVVDPSINLYSFSHTLECMVFLDYNSLVMLHKTTLTAFQTSLMKTAKSCGLHSSWWHFCQREAMRTNFFYVLECYDDGFEESIKNQIRISLHNNVLFALKDVHNSILDNCGSTAHSLLCFGPYTQYMVPLCFGLKLLKRLDALSIRFYEFPMQVLELVKLTYLALTCNRKLPPSISKLKELEYLIVHPHMSIKHRGALSYLPVEIWEMENLKLLDVMGCDLPDLGEASLHKLMKLSNVTDGSCVAVKKVPNLKKLGIKISLTEERLVCFDHISNLTELESLKCVIVNPQRKIEIASFQCLPFSLKKVSLSGMGYPWEEMSKLSSLPNLEMLKLRCNAFRGPTWEVEKDGFQNLLSLEIEDVDLVKGKWTSGSFKLLINVVIKHCYRWKELQFESLQDLYSFKVVDCNPLFEMDIKRKLLNSRNETLQGMMVQYSWKSTANYKMKEHT